MTTEGILQLVEWQGEVPYITRKGKLKPYVGGIPTKRFWDAWKRHKDMIRSIGITLRKVSSGATGEYRIRKGKQIPVRRSQWEVQLWNTGLITGGKPESQPQPECGMECPF